VKDGLGLLSWDPESFAYADSFDEAHAQYRGLRYGQNVNVSEDNQSGLLVKPEVARRLQRKILTSLEILPERPHVKPGDRLTLQVKGLDQDGQPMPVTDAQWMAAGGTIDSHGVFTADQEEGEYQLRVVVGALHTHATVLVSRETPPPPPPADTGLRRFHGSVTLDPTRVGRDAGRTSLD
jgi:hypothetical protein